MGRYSDNAELLSDSTLSGLQFIRSNYSGEYVYHKVELGEKSRLDLISYKYFQNPEYWWVIAYCNDLIDPLFELRAGSLIRIPESLQDFLSSLYVGDV